MKTLACILSALLISASSALAAANQNIFVFLSVRMKGNGDGTITAVAQNEFAIGSCTLPVTLYLYRSDEFCNDVADMAEITCIYSGDLNIFQKITIDYTIYESGYFRANITYEINGAQKSQQCDTIYYTTDGRQQ